MLIDTHTHLDSKEFTNDIIDVIKNAKMNGVYSMITAGVDLHSSRRNIEISEINPGIWAAVGIHPHDAKSFKENVFTSLQHLSNHPKVVAIGEIGLDYYRDYSPREIQQAVFRKQLELAKDLELPVIIHIREAYDDAMKILAETWGPCVSGILHSFSGTLEAAKWGIDHNFLIGINGAITFKNFKNQELIRNLPLDKLVVETDCPYITPVPYRGRRNEPAYVRYTAEKLAEILEVPLAEIEETTTRNACSIFGIPEPPKEPPSLFPQRSLSQNFLRDRNIARKIVDLIGPDEEIVIEIGPGKGELTRILTDRCRKIYAVELDSNLARELNDFAWNNVVVINQDFLKFNLKGIEDYENRVPRVVGNIPYNITSPIIFHLVESRDSFSAAVLMVQREVGRRLVAKPGTKDYGIPSIVVQLFFDIELSFSVSAKAFHPQPSVGSVVVLLKTLPQPRYPVDDYDVFNNLVRGAFNKRRKTLFNALKENPFMYLNPDTLEQGFENVGLSRSIRPEQVSLKQYVKLGNFLCE